MEFKLKAEASFFFALTSGSNWARRIGPVSLKSTLIMTKFIRHDGK